MTPTYPPDLIELFRAAAIAITARAIAQHPRYDRLTREIEAGRIEVRVAYDIRRGAVVVGLVKPNGDVIETIDIVDADAPAAGLGARQLGLIGPPGKVH
jgi:hypothetical protein